MLKDKYEATIEEQIIALVKTIVKTLTKEQYADFKRGFYEHYGRSEGDEEMFAELESKDHVN